LERHNLRDLNAMSIGRCSVFVLYTQSTAFRTQTRSVFKGDKHCTSKAKVKLSLSMLWGHTGWVQLCTLNLGTRWRWVVNFTCGRFTLGEKNPGSHGI